MPPKKAVIPFWDHCANLDEGNSHVAEVWRIQRSAMSPSGSELVNDADEDPRSEIQAD